MWGIYQGTLLRGLHRSPKGKLINKLKHQKIVQRHHGELGNGAETGIARIEEIFLEKEIRDSQLRMIFTCCHPALPTESQISLTLKTLCGFGVKEIARALLTNEATINKRLYRAKQKMKSHEITFEIPSGRALGERLTAVSLALYLLFNEGYNSSHPQIIIRRNLCAEAMRLLQLLIEFFPGNSNLYALLSLMCFHVARFEARIDKEGAIVIFEEQDRGLWDKKLIGCGVKYLHMASTGDLLTEYHLQAGIAAEHCLAKSFEETDWSSIYHQYELLYQIKKPRY